MTKSLSRISAVLKHYLTFWHLQRVFVYLFVDVFLLAFVRRGQSDAVLILKFDQLGDYIIARNFLKQVRRHEPFRGRKIVLCGNSALKEFIEIYDADAYDEIIWVDRGQLLNSPRARFAMLRQIKQRGAQTVIHCAYGLESFGADSLMRASGARECFGRWVLHSTEGGRGVPLGSTFYTSSKEHDRVIFDFYRHQTLFSAALPGTELPTNTKLVPQSVPGPQVDGPYAVLMPGASDAFREWPPERFAQVARHLYETRKWRIFVLGTKAESAKAVAIQEAAPGVMVENLCGQLSLPQVVDFLSRCEIGITNDSGGIHLLGALGRYGVAISNCFSFGLFHPYPREISATVSFVYPQAFYDLPLSMPERKALYGTGEHYPITDVTTEAVIERVEALLSGVPFRDPLGKEM